MLLHVCVCFVLEQMLSLKSLGLFTNSELQG